MSSLYHAFGTGKEKSTAMDRLTSTRGREGNPVFILTYI
jgi:hypothetical protein